MDHSRKITDDIYWVGASDRRLALFENVHPLHHGVSYNAYVLLDEKTVLFDTADWAVGRQFIDNVAAVLGNRSLDYLVLNHVEPDHAASLSEVLLRWPQVKLITTAKAVQFLGQFGFQVSPDQVDVVKEGDERSFGKHTVTFVSAPMVHWPEVMVTFDKTAGVLFSADAFGTFRSLDGKLFADEFDFERDFLAEARRYYANIVGKFGPQVQTLLKKAAGLDIQYICPLHGPVWRKDIGWFVDKYAHWSAYEPEEKGILVVYASMYGGTEQAAEALCAKLTGRGVLNTRLYDVSTVHVSELISEIFKYSHLVLAGVTYNMGLFPPMHTLLTDMKALNVQNRVCALVENGSWAIRSGALMTEELSSLKNITLLEPKVTLTSTLAPDSDAQLDALADALAASVGE